VSFFRFFPDFARDFDVFSRSYMFKNAIMRGVAMEELPCHQSLAVRNCLQLIHALNHTWKIASVVELYFLKRILSSTENKPLNIHTNFGSLWNTLLSIVCFLLGSSPASEFYMPTFQNTLSVPSSWAGKYEVWRTSYLPAFEDGTECSETSAYQIQTPENYPKESIQYL